jgi:hypothetical protein
VSEVAKTDICSLNPDVFSEEDFISGEVPTTGSATMKVDSHSPIRGVTDSGHGRDDTSSRGVIDSSGEAVTIALISPFPPFLAGRFKEQQDQSAVRNLHVDSKESCNRRGGRNEKKE